MTKKGKQPIAAPAGTIRPSSSCLVAWSDEEEERIHWACVRARRRMIILKRVETVSEPPRIEAGIKVSHLTKWYQV